MSKDVTLTVNPQPFDLNMGGSVGTDVTVQGLNDIQIGGVDGHPFVSVSTVNSVSTLGGIQGPPIGLNSTSQIGLEVSINSLPNIIFGMVPTRVHLPVHLRFGLCALGVELLAFSICGESMVVVEPYVAHQTEKCS